jgi:hypothetical protein
MPAGIFGAVEIRSKTDAVLTYRFENVLKGA